MTTITKITSEFYRCGQTLNGRDDLITVIASSWEVRFSNGTKKIYNITLSPDYLDENYDSKKDFNRKNKDYYIQIDDDPPTLKHPHEMQESFYKIKFGETQYKIVCPKNNPGNPIYFYLIKPINFNPISLEATINDSEKIAWISKHVLESQKSFFDKISNTKISQEDLSYTKPQTKDRCKKFDLDENETKILFYDLFEKCLINYIKEKDPSIIDRRKKVKTEKSHLIKNESTTCCCSIRSIFANIFCCR